MELETQLAEVKAELGARKEEVRVMIEEMEKISRGLAARTCPSPSPSHLNATTRTLY